jgi:hypothetical protein
MLDQHWKAFFWVVPAQIEGAWVMTGIEGGPLCMNISQVFQNIGGTLTRGGQTLTLLGAKLRGDEVKFQFVTPDRKVHSFSGRLEGGRLTGTVVADFSSTSVEMTRP